MTANPVRGALRRVPLFEGLGDDDLARLERLLRHRRYGRGESIFFEGDPGEGMYVVIDGRVRIYRSGIDGREQTMEILGPGDPFGAVVLFDGGDYPAGAEAADDALVGMLASADLERFLVEQPPLCLKILKILSARLRESKDQLADLALKDVRGRIASALLQLVQKHGIETPAGTNLDLGLTHQQLAHLVGATRETVTRVLKELRDRQVIAIDRKGITITDPDQLEQLSY